MGAASEELKRLDWCTKYVDHPAVLRWLEKNPPPKTWQATRVEWAYLEMPVWPWTFK